MIISFGAKNFFCFREGIDISFKLNTNCPESISKGRSLSNILCFKGANGSGKTNALKILPLFRSFCCNSFSLKPDEEIDIEPFFNNEIPTEFYIEFIINEMQYKYEVTLSKKKVFSEKIYRTISRTSLLLERIDNKVVYCIKEFMGLKIIKLRSNASIISTANQYEILTISDIYTFFKSMISNVYCYGLYERKLDCSFVSKLYKNDDDLFGFMKKIIKRCDLGINDIKIFERIDENNKKIYFPVFYHKTKDGTKSLIFLYQSSGTRTLYLDLFYYYYSLNKGSVLVLDEFDINYHPDILPLLLDLFINSKSNRKNAQLIFTTHNARIMDYMSRYRTYLINKEDNESYGYRLDEIPGDLLRNDRSIIPIYESGKIGGKPRLWVNLVIPRNQIF